VNKTKINAYDFIETITKLMESWKRDCHFFLHMEEKWLMYNKKKKSLEIN